MKKGMIFDLYQDDMQTERVMALNDKDVIVLSDQSIRYDIDFENEVEGVLIDNILDYGSHCI